MLKPWGTKLDFHSSGTDGLEKMTEERKSEKKKKSKYGLKEKYSQGLCKQIKLKVG